MLTFVKPRTMRPAPASALARRGRRGSATSLGPPSLLHWRRGRGRRWKISSPFYCCSSGSSSHCVFFLCGTTFRFTDSNLERKKLSVFPLTNQSNLFREGESGGDFFALSILPLFGRRHRLKCCPSLSSSSSSFPNGGGERKKREESAFFRSFPCVFPASERALQQVHLIQVYGLQNYLNALD